MERQGPFWDAIEGRVDLPPATRTLGFELIVVDPDAGTIQVGFFAADSFLNPVRVIQGGFLAAMSDETLGPASPRPLALMSSPPWPIFTSSSCSG